MSDTSQGEGWWLASDGKWYPPESAAPQPQPATAQPKTTEDLFPQREVDDPPPAPGELKLVGRRAWKSWQLVVVAVIAAGLGMLANYRTVGSASANANKPAYSLPTASGTASTTTTTSSTAGGATTTTTAAGTSSTTTPGSPATTGTTLPAQLLLAGHQQSGNWTSTPFTTTAAGWIIGWAFQCTPAPASGPSLQIFVAPVGGTASSTPAISETGASGVESQANETTQSAIGQETLVVEAPANCEWAVKVTGN